MLALSSSEGAFPKHKQKQLLTKKHPKTLDNRCTDVVSLQYKIHESQTQLSTIKTQQLWQEM